MLTHFKTKLFISFHLKLFIVSLLLFLSLAFYNGCTNIPSVYRFDDYLDEAIVSDSKKIARSINIGAVNFDFKKATNDWIELSDSYNLETVNGCLKISPKPLNKIEVEFPREFGVGEVRLQVLNPPYDNKHSSTVASIEVIESNHKGINFSKSLEISNTNKNKYKPLIKNLSPSPFILEQQKTLTIIGNELDPSAKVKFIKQGFNPVIKEHIGAINDDLYLRNSNPLNVDTKLIGEIDIKIKIRGTPYFYIGCTEDINQSIQFVKINFPEQGAFFHYRIKPASLRSFQGDIINYIVMKFHPEEYAPQVEIEYIRFLPKKAKYSAERTGTAQEIINNQLRNGIFLQCPGSLEYELKLSEGGLLNFGMGILSPQEPVMFSLWLKDRKNERKLFSQYIDNSERWFDASVKIPPQKYKEVTLRFRCESKHPGSIAFWSNPYLLRKDVENKNEKPNIIIYLIDALRADNLGVYGYPRAVSPHIDKIAHQGILFRNCYSSACWTRPAVPSLLTSLYPLAHGVSDYRYQLPDAVSSLAEILRAEGYFTAMMTDNPHVGSTANMQQGFDFLLEQPAISGLFKSRLKDVWLAHNSSALLNEKVFPWLEQNKEVPFFLLIHNMDVHAPYIPPLPFDDLFDPDYKGDINGTFDSEKGFRRAKTPEDINHVRALYDGEIRNVDEHIRRMMIKIKNLQVDKRTFLIITADHGEEFLDHNGWNHGKTLFNELLKVPLILYFPDKLPEGKIVETPVSIVDIMPTILDVLNIEQDSYAEGESLLAIVNDNRRKNAYLFSSHKRRVVSVIDFPWKFIFDLKTHHSELYNLEDDPMEKRNLFEERPDLVKKYTGIIIKWASKQRKTLNFFRSRSLQRIEIKPEEIEALRALGYLQG